MSRPAASAGRAGCGRSAPGVRGAGQHQCPAGPHGRGPAVVNVGGGVQAKAAVAVLVVVPLKVRHPSTFVGKLEALIGWRTGKDGTADIQALRILSVFAGIGAQLSARLVTAAAPLFIWWPGPFLGAVSVAVLHRAPIRSFVHRLRLRALHLVTRSCGRRIRRLRGRARCGCWARRRVAALVYGC
jgi:uncharacterized membrane protein YfcA